MIQNNKLPTCANLKLMTVLFIASAALPAIGDAQTVPTYIPLNGGMCINAPPVNRPLSTAEAMQNARCAQQMGAEQEQFQALQREVQRKIAEGKVHPMHDVPPDPADCQATADLTALTMENDGVSQQQARMKTAADIVKQDQLFNVHTRLDQCPQPETQLIYSLAEAIRNKRRSP